jgi:hypothetical protein
MMVALLVTMGAALPARADDAADCGDAGMCKRRSNDPSLKRPGIPVAPE